MMSVLLTLALNGDIALAQGYPQQPPHPQQPIYNPIPRPGRPYPPQYPPGPAGVPPGAPGPMGGPGPMNGGAYSTYPNGQNGPYDQNQQMDDQRSQRLQGLSVKFFSDAAQGCTGEFLTSIIFTGQYRLDTEMCRGLSQYNREQITNVEINGICQKFDLHTNPISACLRVLSGFYNGDYSRTSYNQ